MTGLNVKQLLIINYSLLILLLVSCKTKEMDEAPEPYGVGVFITCEGPFQTGTGTISFFERYYGTVHQDIFEKVNDWPLGNIVNSMEIHNGKGYIVVNNAGKIEVVDPNTFKSAGTITGLSSPRYFIGITSSKAYVSDWPYDIAVVDLNNFSVTKTLHSGVGPDRMLKYGDKVFVLNMYNSTFYSYDSTVTVIDTKADTVIKKIQIFNVPSGIVLDKNNKIWIICNGRGYDGYPSSTDSEGHLIRVNPNDYTIEKDFAFPDKTVHPAKLIINKSGDKLFYTYSNAIYRFGINDASLSTSPFIPLSYTPYGMGYDPSIDYIYESKALVNQNGWVFRYRAETGAKVDSFKVGIYPGNFCFN
jgi:DNA-binding beta-propeller fold protein YncE